MQCWTAINHLNFDPDLQAAAPYAGPELMGRAIRGRIDHIAREYRILAGWRTRFRV